MSLLPIKCLPQFCSRVLAVSPTCFTFNPETAEDDIFMHSPKDTPEVLTLKAKKEHDNYVQSMKEAGIEVNIVSQSDPTAYDSIFPDWFTLQTGNNIPEGVLTIFPMKCPSRRRERNPELIAELKKKCKYFIDLSYLESQSEFLEGKGSVLYDHRNFKIYCCQSHRATPKAMSIYLSELNKISKQAWKLIMFPASTPDGSVYHTDCMMQLLNKHALVCCDTLKTSDKEKVLDELTNKSKNVEPYKIIDISLDEARQMCCNVLQVINHKNEYLILMSKQAFEGYSEEHKEELHKYYKFVASNLGTVEYVGGGSARCMLAELFY